LFGLDRFQPQSTVDLRLKIDSGSLVHMESITSRR
jgi:hypothetical protein